MQIIWQASRRVTLWTILRTTLDWLLRVVLWTVLTWIFRAIFFFLRELFFPPKPKRIKPVGYWARDERNRWELRVPAYRLEEYPPESRPR